MIAACLGFRNWHLEHLHQCLLSLEQQAYTMPIIVVDLGSDPFILGVVRQITRDRATLIVHPHAEWSRSAALNLASCHVPFAITHLVFTDADMIFPSDWGHVATAMAVNARDVVWLTRSRDLDQLHTRTLSGVFTQRSLESITSAHDDVVGQGAGMLFPRALFANLRGFDEAYKIWGAEDNDLVRRVQARGTPIAYLPDTFVVHQWHRRDWVTPAQMEQVRANRLYLDTRDRHDIVRNLDGWHGDRGWFCEEQKQEQEKERIIHG